MVVGDGIASLINEGFPITCFFSRFPYFLVDIRSKLLRNILLSEIRCSHHPPYRARYQNGHYTLAHEDCATNTASRDNWPLPCAFPRRIEEFRSLPHPEEMISMPSSGCCWLTNRAISSKAPTPLAPSLAPRIGMDDSFLFGIIIRPRTGIPMCKQRYSLLTFRFVRADDVPRLQQCAVISNQIGILIRSFAPKASSFPAR